VDVVIATLTMTPDRQDRVAFSEVYYVASQQLLVKTNSAIVNPNDLVGKTVAVVKFSTAEAAIFELIPTARVLTVSDYEEALRALDYEQAAAILADDTILLGMMQQYPGQYRLTDERLTTEPYAAAVAKGNRWLLNAVDLAIRHFKASGAWAASFAQHFPDRPLPEPPQIARRATLADLCGRTSPQDTAKQLNAPPPLAEPGTILRRIQDRGYIIIAVKDNIPGFGYRNLQGQFSGFEIDLARAVAQYIFGDPSRVQFKPAKEEQRIPLLHSVTQFFEPILKPFGILSTSLTSNWWHLGMAGKLPEFLCPQECVGEQDFVGLDYYWGISSLRLNQIQQLMDAAFGRFYNAPVWPGVLYDLLKFHARLFPDKEILVIENGCVDVADGMNRATYIRQHLQQVQRARHDGIKVAGYVCWSITSNREWGLKFAPSSDFGLYHIELDKDPDLNRIPTEAVAAYQEMIKNRGV
jgi:ABC-type amino acid transport substrate-binding protein